MLVICLFAVLIAFWFVSSFLGRMLTAQSEGMGNGIPVLAGTVFIVSTLAVIFSSGMTIMFPVPIVFVFLLFQNRKSSLAEIAKGSIRDTIALTLFSAVLICFALPVFNGLETEKVLTGDYLFYGKLGEFIVKTGIETKDLNYFASPKGTEVYHYFDVWLIGFLKKATGCNLGQSVFVAYAVLLPGILWLLISDVVKLFLNVRAHFLISALVLVVLLGLSGATYLFSFVFSDKEFGDFNGLIYPKVILIYLVAMSLFIAVWRKDNWLVVLVAFVSIFLYATILPALTGMVIVYFIVNYNWKIFEWKQLFPILFLVSGCLVFGAFYLVFPSGYDPNEIYTSGIGSSGIGVRINIFGKTTIYILLGLLPLLVLFFINRKSPLFKAFRSLLMVFLGGMFSGLLAWALVCHKTDSVQLWSNFYYPAVGTLYMVFIIGFFRKWSFYVISLIVIADFGYPGINQHMIANADYTPGKFVVFNDKKVGFLNFYDPRLNVFYKNDKVFFGYMNGLFNFSHSKVISLSMPEVVVKDADYEAIVRSSNCYSIRKFDVLDTIHRLDYQRNMIKQLDLDYIFIHRKRVENSVAQLLDTSWHQVESPEPQYQLYKKIN